MQGIHGRNAHWRVAKIARELAEYTYEVFAKNDIFYRTHPDGKAWVVANVSKFLQSAREALADALASDKLNSEQKDEIIDALAKDQVLMPKQSAPRRLSLH